MLIDYNNNIPPIEELVNLYREAGWLNYSDNKDLLSAAFNNSQDVISAYANNEELIGIIRAVGDKCSILYIQDIIVANAYKRKGVGTKLVNMLISKYPQIRQIVLLTDDVIGTRKFYESIGFEESKFYKTICLTKFNIN